MRCIIDPPFAADEAIDRRGLVAVTSHAMVRLVVERVAEPLDYLGGAHRSKLEGAESEELADFRWGTPPGEQK